MIMKPSIHSFALTSMSFLVLNVMMVKSMPFSFSLLSGSCAAALDEEYVST